MIEQIQGYSTENAIKYHYGAFPPANLDYQALAPYLVRASAALAGYNVVLKHIPNSSLLLAPLRRQEAVISSRIEGTIATLEEVLKFEAESEDGEKSQKYRTEAIEVFSYSRALNHAQKLIEDGLPLCGRLIKEAHGKFLFFGRGADKQPGQFKTEQNYIADKAKKEILFIPISAEKLDEGIKTLEIFLNDEKAIPLIQTALSHVEFESLHPFKDGNGRVGRLLVPLCLWSKGLIQAPHFYVSSVLEARREEYIDRLRLVSAKQQWTEWCIFFLNIIEEQAKQNLQIAESIFKLYDDMKHTFRKELRSGWMLVALDYMFANPIFRNSNFTNKAGIPKQTAARFTKVLLERKILTSIEAASGRRPGLYAFEPLLKIIQS